MGNWRNHILGLFVLILWLIPTLLAPSVPLARAQGPDWSWLSPDLDGDGFSRLATNSAPMEIRATSKPRPMASTGILWLLSQTMHPGQPMCST